MATEIGYVSSYDAERGLGYIRPVDRPKELVQFRDAALLESKDVVRIAAGQEVTFERDEELSTTAGRPAAGSVRINETSAMKSDKPIRKEVNKL